MGGSCRRCRKTLESALQTPKPCVLGYDGEVINLDWYLATAGISFLVIVYVVTVLAGWVLTLFGLPGIWLIPLAGVGFDFLVSSHPRLEVTWPVILALVLLGMVGEACEFLAGAAGVARQGGSRFSAFLALVGSFAGGIVGAVVGLPIPVIGSVVGVLLFASLGALVGAVLGEDFHGRDFNGSLGVGVAAFWGRLLGSLAKTLVGGIMVAVALLALVF